MAESYEMILAMKRKCIQVIDAGVWKHSWSLPTKNHEIDWDASYPHILKILYVEKEYAEKLLSRVDECISFVNAEMLRQKLEAEEEGE